GADGNARDVAKLFKGQEGKLYREVQAVTLINEQATRDNILAALECLQEEFRPGDMAVGDNSGHGGESRGHCVMAPLGHRGNPWSRAGMVTERDLRERLEKLPGRVILILDSCHSGAFGDGVSNRSVKGEAGLVVFAAALYDQVGWYNLLLGHGYFTYALLEA